jgi:hypothetical protein
MTVSRRINFDVPIPMMIERLKSEHVTFESKLVQTTMTKLMKSNKELIHLQGISGKIIHHRADKLFTGHGMLYQRREAVVIRQTVDLHAAMARKAAITTTSR